MSVTSPKVITLGDIMMRLSPPGHQRLGQARTFEINYGGSEANVSVALAQWGVASAHVTKLPAHELGANVIQHLRASGVDTDHIALGGERLGLYFLEHGANQRSSKVVYDRFHSSFAEAQPGDFNWSAIFQDAQLFHWGGITPALSSNAAAICFAAVREARKLGLTISADINYRRNLWNYGKNAVDVMPSLIAESDIVLGGLTDFDNCMGIQANDFSVACEQVQKKFPSVKIIINTERESLNTTHNRLHGLLWDGKALHRSKQYDVYPVIDRVGSGDAFMAGYIFCALAGWPLQERVEFATAACVLKHTVPGDVNQASVEEVTMLMKDINVGKLLR